MSGEEPRVQPACKARQPRQVRRPTTTSNALVQANVRREQYPRAFVDILHKRGLVSSATAGPAAPSPPPPPPTGLVPPSLAPTARRLRQTEAQDAPSLRQHPAQERGAWFSNGEPSSAEPATCTSYRPPTSIPRSHSPPSASNGGPGRPERTPTPRTSAGCLVLERRAVQCRARHLHLLPASHPHPSLPQPAACVKRKPRTPRAYANTPHKRGVPCSRTASRPVPSPPPPPPTGLPPPSLAPTARRLRQTEAQDAPSLRQHPAQERGAWFSNGEPSSAEPATSTSYRPPTPIPRSHSPPPASNGGPGRPEPTPTPRTRAGAWFSNGEPSSAEPATSTSYRPPTSIPRSHSPPSASNGGPGRPERTPTPRTSAGCLVLERRAVQCRARHLHLLPASHPHPSLPQPAACVKRKPRTPRAYANTPHKSGVLGSRTASRPVPSPPPPPPTGLPPPSLAPTARRMRQTEAQDAPSVRQHPAQARGALFSNGEPSSAEPATSTSYRPPTPSLAPTARRMRQTEAQDAPSLRQHPAQERGALFSNAEPSSAEPTPHLLPPSYRPLVAPDLT
ncbi:uncharacterized protein B0H18DRAFT_1120994 [Fomitopsis serialis]|uniref:uncharacterized protein n=1 Tax=Fomitopsis serialis TaxID=139415 RepID=UPI0020077176|nr:uncharacterized protein B0H18DRAFT_1120994 [Neoantrodia serialis]KAH9922437.1 hypothetical protein B0H18DRAFT_1120994 [Neoantrodia serialis]